MFQQEKNLRSVSTEGHERFSPSWISATSCSSFAVGSSANVLCVWNSLPTSGVNFNISDAFKQLP